MRSTWKERILFKVRASWLELACRDGHGGVQPRVERPQDEQPDSGGGRRRPGAAETRSHGRFMVCGKAPPSSQVMVKRKHPGRGEAGSYTGEDGAGPVAASDAQWPRTRPRGDAQAREALLDNLYSGFVPVEGWAPEVLGEAAVAALGPRGFFQTYVAARKPVIIPLGSAEAVLGRSGWWSAGRLAEAAGDERVSVEWRGSGAEGFGRGQEKGMEFRQFLERLQQGDESLYLSTQDIPVDPEGRPLLASPFMERVLRAARLPLRPAIAGNLALQVGSPARFA